MVPADVSEPTYLVGRGISAVEGGCEVGIGIGDVSVGAELTIAWVGESCALSAGDDDSSDSPQVTSTPEHAQGDGRPLPRMVGIKFYDHDTPPPDPR